MNSNIFPLENTKILNKEYTGKIEAKLPSGELRSLYVKLNNPALELITEDLTLKEKLTFLADEQGKLLANREAIYYAYKGEIYKLGKSFNAEIILDSLKSKKEIIEYSDYSYKKGLAREVRLKRQKNFSNYYFNLIVNIIEKSMVELYDELEDFYLESNYKDFSIPAELENSFRGIKKKMAKIECHLNSVDPQKIQAITIIYKKLLEIKREQIEGQEIDARRFQKEYKKFKLEYKRLLRQYMGGKNIEESRLLPPDLNEDLCVNLKLITNLVAWIIPQNNQATACKVWKRLKVKYNIQDITPYIKIEVEDSPEVRTEAEIVRRYIEFISGGLDKEDVEIQVVGGTEIEEVRVDSAKELMDKIVHGKGVFQNTPLPESYNLDYSDSLSHNPAYSTSTPDITPSTTISSSLYTLASDSVRIPAPRLSTFDVSPTSTGVLASNLVTQSVSLYTRHYNTFLLDNLLSSVPVDYIDARQIEQMLSFGSLPDGYSLTGDSGCPRFHSINKDNLAYCRKELRMAVLKDLGLFDVDIENCHAKIAISLWGDKLPTLANVLNTGSLWDYYSDLFTSNSVPFYKALVKQMHHATLLSGGKTACLNALHRYNLQHKASPISDKEFELIYKFFVKIPLVAELKALFTWFGSHYDGKSVTLLNGTVLKVKDTKWALYNRELKRTGSKSKAEKFKGNVPTVIACILQAYETAATAYMMLRTQEYMLPVLWQFDGFTCLPLYAQETFNALQVAIDEFSDKYLNGVRLNFTVKEISSEKESEKEIVEVETL